VTGLTVPETRTTLVRRGLSLGSKKIVLTATRSGRVLDQSPGAPALVHLGTSVGVSISQRRIELLSARRLDCAVGGKLSARVRLASPLSNLQARFYTEGRFDWARQFGRRADGTRTLTFRIPYILARPAVYWIEWKATTPGGVSISSWMRIHIRPLYLGEVDPPPCRPA
jgi:hypothetical protein